MLTHTDYPVSGHEAHLIWILKPSFPFSELSLNSRKRLSCTVRLYSCRLNRCSMQGHPASVWHTAAESNLVSVCSLRKFPMATQIHNCPSVTIQRPCTYCGSPVLLGMRVGELAACCHACRGARRTLGARACSARTTHVMAMIRTRYCTTYHTDIDGSGVVTSHLAIAM